MTHVLVNEFHPFSYRSVKTAAMDDTESSNAPMRLRYQIHRGTREIFRASANDRSDYDTIHASSAYMAVGDARDNLPPRFIGSHTQPASNHSSPERGLDAVKIALKHALETVHGTLRAKPDGFHVRIGIYSDNDTAISLIQKTVKRQGLKYHVTRHGAPKPDYNILDQTLTLHQKIKYLLGRDNVKIDYRLLDSNTQPYFDQNIVKTKCNEILDRMQEEYYASRRWNQISRFVRNFDCHGWLRGDCHIGPEKCLYRHRLRKFATGMPPYDQSNIGKGPVRKIPACKYWAQGKCFNGGACKFAHEGVGGVLERPVCIYWKQGECFNGLACGFRHGEVVTSPEPECAEVDLCISFQDVEIGRDNRDDGKPGQL